MQQLGTGRSFVEDQYSDASKLRIRIETHERYSQGDTEQLIDAVVNALDLRPGETVLDLGCGAGDWFARLQARGASVVGVDLMSGMLREARRKTLHPKLLQADLQAIPLRRLGQSDPVRRSALSRARYRTGAARNSSHSSA